MAERRVKEKIQVKKPKNETYEETDLSNSTNTFEKELEARSVQEIVHQLEESKDGRISIDARVLFHEKGTSRAHIGKLDKTKFIEAFKSNSKKRVFKESVDEFITDTQGSNLVGSDFTPLLGGPFNKQLYYHDYLKMHALAFHAYNHDPIAHALTHIQRDFVLGRGWRVDCDDPKGLVIWRAFEKANNLRLLVEQFVTEISIYGEQMPWWLPGQETKIAYDVLSGQEPPKGLIPRIRLIDPSVIWEIVTYPEDITRVLYYQWIAPTQYQLYTGTDGGKPVPGLKWIFQQIPADQIMHYKINCMSNEKRGRSDLFPILGYLKRMRDSVNYSIIALQKATAWSVDTTIDGSKDDIDSYMESQKEFGTIPPAGSEFVHSKKIERKYMSNEGAGRSQNSNAFDWCLSMVCAGYGIPMSYLGTHLSGGHTRAGAVVATEPVAKKFEARRQIIEDFLKDCADRLFEQFNIDADIEVTFPELITQDRSAKLKDLALSEMQGWMSRKRVASMAAKEFEATDFEYETELKDIAMEQGDPMPPVIAAPLSTPGSLPAPGSPPQSNGGISGGERKDAKNAGT